MKFTPNEKQTWEPEEILNDDLLYGMCVFGPFEDDTKSKYLWLSGRQLKKLHDLLGPK